MDKDIKMHCEMCGSDQIEIVEKAVSINLSFGEKATYNKIICVCKSCGEEVDITDQKEQQNAVTKAEIKILGSIINFIAKQGYSFARLERALDLPQRTISRWYSGKEPSAAGTTLLKFIRMFPWLIKIAEEDFNEDISKKIFMHAFIDEFHEVRESIAEDQHKKLSYFEASKSNQEIKCFCMSGATYLTTLSTNDFCNESLTS